MTTLRQVLTRWSVNHHDRAYRRALERGRQPRRQRASTPERPWRTADPVPARQRNADLTRLRRNYERSQALRGQPARTPRRPARTRASR